MTDRESKARWLVVTLMAPMASFGERGGNVERSTSDRPTRSGLIGLAGAALGIRRDDAGGQERLRQSFRTALSIFGSGTLVSDFHTFESLPASRNPPQTRAEALARRDDLATSITRREYRADVWFEVAYTANEPAFWSLDELSEAFRQPQFTLYLGRKSCPLSAPLNPKIIVGDLSEVFSKRRDESPYLDRGNPLYDTRARRHRGGTISAERLEDLGQSNRPPRRHRRYDDPGDRVAWHFTSREEFLLFEAQPLAR